MLKLYGASIMFFFIIIYASIKIFAEQIKENGWLDGAKPIEMGAVTAIILLACVPLVRLAAVYAVYMMAFKKK